MPLTLRRTSRMQKSNDYGGPRANADLDSGMIHIRQRADLWGRLGKPKSKAGNRDIPLAPMAINALGEWLPQCPASKADLMFPDDDGDVESHGDLLAWFRRLQIATGMTKDGGKRDGQRNVVLEAKYGLHALRHAAASLFI